MWITNGAEPPRRASPNMVGNPECETDQGHECPAQGSGSTGILDATMRDIGRAAREAARALALAPAAQKNRALAAMAEAIRAFAVGYPRRQCAKT